MKTTLPLLLLLVATTGCARLAGPAYERPDVPVAIEWTAPAADEIATLRPDWWNTFGDPELTRLVEQALGGNFDLRVAAGRVTRAEAVAGLTASRRLPTVGLNAGGTFGRQDAGTGATSFESYEVGGGLNWELDLWGKLKKGEAAADADLRASGADWRAAYLVVASQVAGQYFRLRQLDDLAAIYNRFIAASENILQLYQARADEQLIAADVVLRQRAELLRLQREARELQRERLTIENGLAALLGQPAGQLRIAPAAGARDALRPSPVPAGLPADLLARRPDILAAEYRVLAAYNLTGQARLDRLPTIALTGSGGSSSDSLGGLLNQWLLGGGPVISIPLFDPAKKRQVAVREAELEIASDQYRSTVIKAFQEVENALVSLESRRQQAGQADDALADLLKAQRINQAQFEEGLISQLQVLESERSLMQSEQIALDLHFRQLNETVTLYKALGGGWPPENL